MNQVDVKALIALTRRYQVLLQRLADEVPILNEEQLHQRIAVIKFEADLIINRVESENEQN